jgi:putative endonuclease
MSLRLQNKKRKLLMATHNDLGKNGEKLAKEYFEKNNYEILHLNWRHSHFEVDIIAGKNNILRL